MSNVFGWDLPGGVTHAMIDEHFGRDRTEACSECEEGQAPCNECSGKGCPENPCEYCLSTGKQKCEECDGTGEVPAKSAAESRADWEESKADEERDERNERE